MSFWGRPVRLGEIVSRAVGVSAVRTGTDGFTPPPGHGVSDGISDLGPKVEVPGASKKGDDVGELPVERDPLPDVATEEIPIEF